MKGLIGIALFASALTSSNLFAQQSYKGTMVTKLGGKQTGIIEVNLDGANNDLIAITTTEKSGSKRSKQTVTTTSKLNVGLISYIIIQDTTWYFRDIKYDYNDKYHFNMPVRLLNGTLQCGVFQTGRATGNNNIAIKLPKEEFSKLVSVDFDYYKATMGWHAMAFGQCKKLQEKMINAEEGYKWDDNTPQNERIKMWTAWVKEFNECK